MRILVIQDHKENRKKCSLTPVEGHPGVTFLRLSSPAWNSDLVEIGSGILLAVDAPLLTPVDAPLVQSGGQLVVLDSTWARLGKLARRFRVAEGARLERRSLPATILTAYPRVSKVHEDPAGGLATIEALFAATAILGEPWPELLTGYHWAEEFLRRNQATLPLASSAASRLC